MDRASSLERCLSSLVCQITKHDEVLVLLDAHSKDASEDVLKKYKKRMPLIYYKTPIRGYPKLYNLAIQKSNKNILVFINDDCHVDASFIASIKQAHKKHPNTVIQGMTYSLPKNNVYAEIMGDNYQNWITTNMLDGSSQMKTIDNKNVSVPRDVFDRVGGYDEKFLKGSEDIEFGKRLVREKIPIWLDSSIVVYHYERNTFSGFVHQHVRIGHSESIVDRSVPQRDRIGLFSWQKIMLHIRSAVCREVTYLRELRFRDFLLLPFLYILLVFIRIYAYRIKKS
jgi:GT2 family glycosyltransferase